MGGTADQAAATLGKLRDGFVEVARFGTVGVSPMTMAFQQLGASAQVMRESITKAIPWTPGDVLAFRDHAGDQDTFRSFVEKNRIGEGGASDKQAPAVGAVQDGYRFKGGNPADQASWEKVQ